MRYLLILLPLVSACNTISQPQVAAEGQWGEAHAPTEELAERLVVALDRQTPLVHAALVEYNEHRASVWLLDTFRVRATVSGERILMRADTMRFPEFFLTHELVHWCAIGTPWARLPQLAEEGLADYLSCRIMPQYEFDRRARHGVVYNAVRENYIDVDLSTRLREDWSNWTDFNEADYTITYALGFAIVDRIGVDSLYQLCLEHEEGVPPALLLERAGLSEDGTGL